MKIFFFTEDSLSPNVTRKFIELSLKRFNFINYEIEEIGGKDEEEDKIINGSNIFSRRKFRSFLMVLRASLKVNEQSIFCFHIDCDVRFSILQKIQNGETDLLKNTLFSKYFSESKEIMLNDLKRNEISIERFVEMFPCNGMENWCVANLDEVSKIAFSRLVQTKINRIKNNGLELADEIGKLKFHNRSPENAKIMLRLVENNFPTKEFYDVQKSFFTFVENLKRAIP